MQTFIANAESLIKQSPTDPWRISLVSPSDESLLKATIGLNGQAEVGPRLSEVLSGIERQTDTYPCVVRWDILTNFDDEFTVKVMNDVIVYVEASIDSYKHFLKKQSFMEGVISSSPKVIEYLPKSDTQEPTQFTISAVNQDLSKTQDYFLIGKLAKDKEGGVRDGDTIDIVVEAMGSKVAEATTGVDGVTPIQIGSTVAIRFVGIQTPETNNHSADYGDDKNAEYAIRYKIDTETAYAIGAEASDYTRNILTGNAYIVIDLDIDSTGKVQHTYDRVMGIVYKTSTVHLRDVIDGKAGSVINLNKSLLVEKSKDHEEIPLAILYTYYANNLPFSRFDVAVWEYELGIKQHNNGDKVGDVSDGIIDEITKPDNPTTVNLDPITIKYADSSEYDNRLNWFKPYDDRMDKPELNLPVLSEYNVRIGDVMLIIPPLSIQYNRASTSQKIQTLRTKQSTIVRSGNSESSLTLQLYFHDLDSINGHKWDNGSGRTYYMDGLRSLIAQFKKAPFLPIDNPYINEVLNIYDVALVDISVSTVPGFPYSLSATLRLAKFDVSPFMPQIPGIGWALNYPMLRWYYQEAMVERPSKLRTYLKPMDRATSGKFNFLIADENDLIYRQKSIEKLRMSATPEEIVDQIQNKQSQIGKLISDAKEAERALKHYDAYMAHKNKGDIMPDDPNTDGGYYRGGNNDLIGISPNSQIDGTPDDVWAEGNGATKIYNHKKIWEDMYGAGVDKADVINAGYFAPFESVLFEDPIWSEIAEKYNIAENAAHGENGKYVDKNLNKIFYDNRKFGFFDIELYTGSNQGMFSEDVIIQTKKDGGTTACIPAVPAAVEALRKIVQAGKDAELQAQADIDEYKKLTLIAEINEGTLPLGIYEIDGLICTSVNVSYQNNFSVANMPSLQGPTMQYLGGQDPQLQVTFEANEEAIEQLREMLEEVDRYAREYKLGITAGFMGVENDIANLFGMDAVVPDYVQISTVPNFPGRFQIDMTLTGFNKTQRRSETLEGISPIYSTTGAVGDVNMADRKYDNTDMKGQDNAVLEYRMRSLEVYPDLELPTYEELNAALSTMGADCLEYLNPSKAKFVDPDFYMATEWTMREDVRAERDKDQRMYFRDMLGVNMYTDSGDGLPINGTEENWTLLRDIDNKTKKVDPRFSWDGTTTNAPVDTGDQNPEDTAGIPPELVEFVNSRENQKVKPTYDEWASWGLSKLRSGSITSDAAANAYKEAMEKEYQEWLKKPQPTQIEIYDYIYEQVDRYFSDYYFNDKNKTDKDKEWADIAYSKGSVDIYIASYSSLTDTDPKSIVENSGDENAKVKITPEQWETAVKGKIPRERLANLIKAYFDNISNWNQFTSNAFPNSTGFGLNMEVGIGGVVIAREATSVDSARRYCYDWKYNIDFSMAKLAQAYKKAADDEDKKKKATPWDWMIHARTDKDFEKDLDNDFLRSTYSTFEKRYNNYDLRYGTAQSPVDIDILEREENITSHQKDLIHGDRDAIIAEMESMGVDMKAYKDKEKYTNSQVKKYYEDYMKDNFGTKDISMSEMSQHENDTQMAIRYGKQMAYPKQYKDWKVYNRIKVDIKEATNTNNLVNMHDPQELFKGMFTDMLDYDMRGRLVRAFPTFQMFIIDEGRWMADYRLWDNLYGFNSIQSIDVHKNRKIVADTAIIKMTNVYNNLTTKPLSEDYGDNEYSFWSNLLFGNPSEKLLDARKELLTGMMLETGARIHLRMGYGSSVEHLPIVFNGTITEMDTQDVMTIVAQGDGIELTNVISGDPKDKNTSWGMVREPRDTICKLMTTKGNWFKDAINYTSGGKFFRDNPLGVQHFGMPSGEITPPGNLDWFNHEYGEVAQNIYSSSGVPTFSQWVYGDGSPIPFTWDGFIPEFQGGDEMNIKMSLYNKTIWDIATTITMCSPDYITAVAPFELRSSLFFGKPYYQFAYRYDCTYEYDESSKQWVRYLNEEVRKPFMQFHWYGNDTDIISNKIKASADGLFTNVIVNYGSNQSDIAYADWDIYNQYQKTTVVEAPIMEQFADFWTSEDQSRMYAYSTIKEYMKDMYQGTLVVLGDPSLKPHDMCYLGDKLHDMQGNFQVKDVTHSFSLETGFISSITPDAVVVNDDMALMNMTAWYSSAAAAVLTRFLGIRLATKAGTAMMGKVMAQKHIAAGTKYSQEYMKKSLNKLMRKLPPQDTHVADYKSAYRAWMKAADAGDEAAKEAAITKMMKAVDNLDADTKIAEWANAGLFDKKGGKFKAKRLLSLMKTGAKVIKDGKNAFWIMRAAGTSILGTSVIGWIAMIGVSVVTETLAEMYRRKKANFQCVLMLPMKHQGRDFTAGIGGHKGMVVGDSPGKLDNFLKGAGWTEGVNAKDEDSASIIDVFDFLANAEGVGPRTVSEDELSVGVYKPK